MPDVPPVTMAKKDRRQMCARSLTTPPLERRNSGQVSSCIINRPELQRLRREHPSRDEDEADLPPFVKQPPLFVKGQALAHCHDLVLLGTIPPLKHSPSLMDATAGRLTRTGVEKRRLENPGAFEVQVPS